MNIDITEMLILFISVLALIAKGAPTISIEDG